MAINKLREKFMQENKGKKITLIFSNGFQMKGKLVDYDDVDVVIDTNAYSSPAVTVQQASVNAFVPASY